MNETENLAGITVTCPVTDCDKEYLSSTDMSKTWAIDIEDVLECLPEEARQY
jgi:hypothetical protein